MQARQNESRLRRVTILSRRPERFAEVLGSDQLDCQILASPGLIAPQWPLRRPDWVVFDVTMMGNQAMRLLDLAGRSGAAVCGVGPLPMGLQSGQLDGMVLLSIESLAQRLTGPGTRRQADPAPPGEDGDIDSTWQPEDPPGPDDSVDRVDSDDDLPEGVEQTEGGAATGADLDDKPLLSAEELAALLGTYRR